MEQLTFARAASDRGKTVFECELCGRCCFTEELAQFLLVSAGQAMIMNAIDVCEFFCLLFSKMRSS